MSESASISSGVAARYATALFDLAKDSKTLAAVEKDLDALADALHGSDDLTALISSPVYSRAAQTSSVLAIGAKMKLSELVSNTLALMASKRRLFVLPQLIQAVKQRIADEKGEVAADVVSASALTKTQTTALATALKKSVGKTVNINATVDENLIGGLVVKVGSRMIDTSIRSRLSNLQNAMKEVG